MKQKFFLAILLSLLILCIVVFAEVRRTDSDPLGSLVVSQAILQQGTIKLDRYKNLIFDRYRCANTPYQDWYNCVIYKKNDHYYYYFPLGTSILAVPFVSVFDLMGFNIINDEGHLQILISAVNAVLTFILLFLLARLHLNEHKSLLLAAVTWFGTSFSSTTATALWSHNFATFFALIAIYLGIRSVKYRSYKVWPVVSISLFFSYLCRPTLILLAPFLIAYIFIHSKKIAIFTSSLFVFFIMAFIGFSYSEFNQVLPDYYYPKRIMTREGDFFKALYGNLLSPARGLVIFSPILLMPIICFKSLHLSLREQKPLLLLFIWPVLHWVIISRFPHWWAGWSYGPRLMTDVLPGLYLLLVLTVAKLDFSKPLFLGIMVVLGGLSIYINTFQGLFNEYTQRWNAEPNIDRYPEYLFDWRYPQFLHNQERHKARLQEFNQRQPANGQGG